MLSAELNATLSAIPAGRGRDLGVALGTSVANQILALRSHDGSNVKVNYVPGTGPGDWVPTPPAYAPAVDPQWGDVTPFALTSGSQFQPPPPPAITSAEYAQEVNQVEALGGHDQHRPDRRPDGDRPLLVGSPRHVRPARTLEPDHRDRRHDDEVQPGELGPGVRPGRHRPGRRRDRGLERQVHVQHRAAGDGDPRRGRRRQPPDHGRPDLDAPLEHARVPVLHLGT